MSRSSLVVTCATVLICASCKRDKPHVPYTIDNSGGDGSAALTNASAVATSPRVERPQVRGADAGQRIVKAAFEEGDVIALAPGKDASERVLVVERPGRSEVERVLTMDTPLDEKHCTLATQLIETGKKSVLFTMTPECAGVTDAFTAPARISELALVSFARDGARTTRMRLERPAGYPDVRVRGDATDLDGDGYDDATWTFELGSARLSFRKFDRGSGMSTDVDEPDASIRKVLTAAKLQVKKPKESAKAAEELGGIALLFAHACGSRPRATLDGRIGLSCGASTVAILEEVRALEVVANVGAGAYGRAMNAYERGYAARTPALEQKWRDARTALERAVTIREASLQTLAGDPEPPTYRPAWRVSFDGDDVLLRTRSGAKRLFIRGESNDEPAEESQPGSGFSIKNWNFTEAFDPGDGVSIHATFMGAGGDKVADIALPVAGTWRPLGKSMALHVVPFAASSDVLYLLCGTESVRIGPDGTATLAFPKEEARAPGSPGASSGKRWVMPTSLGLYVGGEPKPTLVRSKEIDNYSTLQSCTIDDAGTRIACVRGGQVYVFRY